VTCCDCPYRGIVGHTIERGGAAPGRAGRHGGFDYPAGSARVCAVGDGVILEFTFFYTDVLRRLVRCMCAIVTGQSRC